MSSQEAQKNPFEKQATSNAYDAVDEVYRKSALGVTDIVKPDSFGAEASVIDIGAGTGISSEVILERGAPSLGVVEPAMAMIEHAKARLEKKAYYVQATIEEMHQAFNKDVDLAYALNCIHLFPDLGQAFAAVAATLKKGGKFVFNITAPSFKFEEVSEQEKAIYQANVDFYKSLNETANNPILAKTVELLELSIEGKNDQSLTKESLDGFLLAMNMKPLEFHVMDIEASIDYQKNIWRMMAKSFVEDESAVEKLIDAVKMPEKMSLKQAVFVVENLN